MSFLFSVLPSFFVSLACPHGVPCPLPMPCVSPLPLKVCLSRTKPPHYVPTVTRAEHSQQPVIPIGALGGSWLRPAASRPPWSL